MGAVGLPGRNPAITIGAGRMFALRVAFPAERGSFRSTMGRVIAKSAGCRKCETRRPNDAGLILGRDDLTIAVAQRVLGGHKQPGAETVMQSSTHWLGR